MSVSAFGVDHGGLSKADERKRGSAGGVVAAGTAVGTAGGAVAARRSFAQARGKDRLADLSRKSASQWLRRPPDDSYLVFDREGSTPTNHRYNRVPLTDEERTGHVNSNMTRARELNNKGKRLRRVGGARVAAGAGIGAALGGAAHVLHSRKSK